MEFFLISMVLLAGKPNQAPPVEVPEQAPPIITCMTYSEGVAEFKKTGKPLVVFVGCAARPIQGAISVRTETMQGYPARCIVASVPDGNGWLQWRETLMVGASDSEIRQAIGLEVRRVQIPSQSFRSAANC